MHALCILFYDFADKTLWSEIFDLNASAESEEDLLKIKNKNDHVLQLCNWAENLFDCRRSGILNHFGEKGSSVADNCTVQKLSSLVTLENRNNFHSIVLMDI